MLAEIHEKKFCILQSFSFLASEINSCLFTCKGIYKSQNSHLSPKVVKGLNSLYKCRENLFILELYEKS